MRKPTPLTERWPCIFRQKSTIDVVEPWISDEWLRITGRKAPFGDLRNQFRKQHCRTLNPYGSETCPFASEECVTAYRSSVAATLRARPRNPMGYFRTVARMEGARRADEGVDRRIRRRYSTPETNVPAAETSPAERPGHTGNEAGSIQTGRGLHSPTSGPTGIGELLGTLDLRPRQLDADEREESAE